MPFNEMKEKAKNGAKGFADAVKVTFNDAVSAINKYKNDYSEKRNSEAAFEKSAVKFEIVGRNNVIGSKSYVFAVKNFGLLKKELYFSSNANTDNILVGTLLKDQEEVYEIKDIDKSIQEYLEYEIEVANNDSNEGSTKVVKKIQFPVFKATVKLK